MTQPQSPRVKVALAVTLRRDAQGQVEVLITKRPAGTQFGGLWEFPGGKVDPGETIEQAVERECLEECGIGVRVERLLGVYPFEYTGGPGTPSRSLDFYVYACRLMRGQVQHLEVDDHRWCTIDDLTSYAYPPATVAFLPSVITALKSGSNP